MASPALCSSFILLSFIISGWVLNGAFAQLLGQWRNIAREVLDHTAILAKFLRLIHIVNTQAITTTQVLTLYGPSMLPTLNLTGDVLLAERISDKIGKVGVGDVVLVGSPENPRRIVAKRVLGKEGDRVTYVSSILFCRDKVESHITR